MIIDAYGFDCCIELYNCINSVSDIQEQYQIKNICLWAIVELLLSCKMYGQVGRRNVGKFHHIPRTNRIRADSIRYIIFNVS